MRRFRGADAVVWGGVRSCGLSGRIGLNGPETEHIDAAAEARNDCNDVGRVHVGSSRGCRPGVVWVMHHTATSPVLARSPKLTTINFLNLSWDRAVRIDCAGPQMNLLDGRRRGPAGDWRCEVLGPRQVVCPRFQRLRQTLS